MTITVADIRRAIADLDGSDVLTIEVEQSGTVIGVADAVSAYDHVDGSVTLTVEI